MLNFYRIHIPGIRGAAMPLFPLSDTNNVRVYLSIVTSFGFLPENL